MPSGVAVRARGLVKRYGTQPAVDGIDLEVPVGGCFGVLGPNGAGKTTLMRMITCVSPPTAGLLEVLGQDVRRDRRAIKRHLGVLPQGMTLDDELTVRENLTSFAAYHDLPRQLARERAGLLLDFVELADRADDRTDELSGGLQRRLLIARALVNDPELVVLDEPTTGLDPQARHHVWERLRTLRRGGKTLLVTTHYMDEAARLCDQVVVMDRGRLIAEGSPGELVEAHTAPRVVEVQRSSAGVQEVRHVVGALAHDIEEVGDRILVYGDEGELLLSTVRTMGVPADRLLLRDATLEDVFLRLTGHTLVD
ncbi:MAG: ABC transporter ATP-binding protein [Actinomycetota bacterium]|nr:ABC transporter ATP-binding protein [Actinomycetota bacterium]